MGRIAEDFQRNRPLTQEPAKAPIPSLAAPQPEPRKPLIAAPQLTVHHPEAHPALLGRRFGPR